MNELLTIYRCTCFHKFLKQSEQVFFVGVFFFVEQTRLVLNDSKYFGIGNFCNCALSTSSSFLVFAIEYSWQSTLFEMIRQRDVFLSPLTLFIHLTKEGELNWASAFHYNGTTPIDNW